MFEMNSVLILGILIDNFSKKIKIDIGGLYCFI